MSKESMLAPPIFTVGTIIRTMPATKRDCGLILLLSSLLRVQERKRFRALQCSGGLRRCALAWGLLLLDDQLPDVQPADRRLPLRGRMVLPFYRPLSHDPPSLS